MDIRRIRLARSVTGLLTSLLLAASGGPLLPSLHAQPRLDALVEEMELALLLCDSAQAQARMQEILSVREPDTVASRLRARAREAVARVTPLTCKPQRPAGTSRAEVRALVQLDVAKRLARRNRDEEALKLIVSAVGDSASPRVLLAADSALALLKSPARRAFDTWVLGVVRTVGSLLATAVGLVLPLLLLALAARRWARTRSERRARRGSSGNPAAASGPWVVSKVRDSTKLGHDAAILAGLQSWASRRRSSAAGLLRLEATGPLLPTVLTEVDNLDIEAAAESVKLQFGGVAVESLGSLVEPFRRWWMKDRRHITGIVSESGGTVFVDLTRFSPGQEPSHYLAKASVAEGAAAVEAATYMVCYAISRGCTVDEARQANALREALSGVGHYTRGRSVEDLRGALAGIQAVKAEAAGELWQEALFCEAVVLDLLEEHDDAIARFNSLTESGAGSRELRDRARYNLAVAQLRKYEWEALDQAYSTFEDLVTADRLKGTPLSALAQAGKLNCIAHVPIFHPLVPGSPEAVARARALVTMVEEGASALVESILDTAAPGAPDAVAPAAPSAAATATPAPAALAAAATAAATAGTVGTAGTGTTSTAGTVTPASVLPAAPAWDDAASRQVRWAAENARGNVYLECGKRYLAAGPAPASDPGISQQGFLEKAYGAFQKCEMLIPPGVETLTNLGTTLSYLSRLAPAGESPRFRQAERYLQRAREMNPHYEYAYFRLAELYREAGRTDDLLRMLADFRRVGHPRIRGFRQLYDEVEDRGLFVS